MTTVRTRAPRATHDRRVGSASWAPRRPRASTRPSPPSGRRRTRRRPPAEPPAAEPPPPRTRTASAPSRSSPTTTSRSPTPPRPGPRPSADRAPGPGRARSRARRPAAPDLDDLDLPPTAAVPVVPSSRPARRRSRRPSGTSTTSGSGLPPTRTTTLEIEAGRSASENPFADLIGDPDDGLDDLLGPPEDDLPHWSEPVAGATDDDDAWAGVSGGPRWRGQGEETGEPEDFSDLADDETRVESLGEDEMIFDDLDPAAAAAASIDSPAGPPQRRNPFPDAPEDEFGRGADGSGGGGSGRDMQQAVIVGVGLVGRHGRVLPHRRLGRGRRWPPSWWSWPPPSSSPPPDARATTRPPSSAWPVRAAWCWPPTSGARAAWSSCSSWSWSRPCAGGSSTPDRVTTPWPTPASPCSASSTSVASGPSPHCCCASTTPRSRPAARWCPASGTASGGRCSSPPSS